MAVPYTFGSATTSIPLSQLDSNFATTITLGNTAVQLGNTITSLTGVSNVASATSLTLGSNGNTTAITVDTSQNVGIGTTSPTAKLQLSAAGDVGGKITNTSTTGSGTWNITNNSGSLVQLMLYGSAQGAYGAIGSGEAAIYSSVSTTIMADNGSSVIKFATGGATERMRIDSSGNLLVGTTSNPAGVKLVIGGTSGTARIEPVTDNVGYIGEGSYRWQAVYAVNGTIQTSDGREKNTIEDSNLGLSFIQSLRPVSYKWNVGENVVTYDEEGKEVVTPRAGVRVHYGFIAQEVKEAIPENVDFGGFVQEPDEGRMSLRYHEFIGPLVKAIQEQQALITAQAETINALTARIVALEAK